MTKRCLTIVPMEAVLLNRSTVRSRLNIIKCIFMLQVLELPTFSPSLYNEMVCSINAAGCHYYLLSTEKNISTLFRIHLHIHASSMFNGFRNQNFTAAGCYSC